MKYLNVKTGCIEESTNEIVLEQVKKYPKLYVPVKDVKPEKKTKPVANTKPSKEA